MIKGFKKEYITVHISGVFFYDDVNNTGASTDALNFLCYEPLSKSVFCAGVIKHYAASFVLGSTV